LQQALQYRVRGHNVGRLERENQEMTGEVSQVRSVRWKVRGQYLSVQAFAACPRVDGFNDCGVWRAKPPIDMRLYQRFSTYVSMLCFPSCSHNASLCLSHVRITPECSNERPSAPQNRVGPGVEPGWTATLQCLEDYASLTDVAKRMQLQLLDK